MRTTSFALFALTLSGAAWLTGCGAKDYSSDDGAEMSGDLGVGQGGAQDFGYFRDILLEGGLPGPESIDDVGFFNEHVIEVPPAECDDDVCVHGRLGMMGNMINGGDCTIVTLAMNTPIDIDDLERPPLNLVLAIDSSGSMAGQPLQYVQSGLRQMLEAVEPGDKVTLITFSGEARVVAEGGAEDLSSLYEAIDRMSANGSTNIYDALDLAYDMVELNAGLEWQNRILLLSDGVATAGVTSSTEILSLAEIHAHDSYRLTTIGIGEEFDIELMQELAEVGEGSFYYVEDPAAVSEVFVDEVTSYLVPLAHDAVIEVNVEPGWEVRAMYGTKDFILTDDRARIEIDTLQIAGRTSDEDNEDGRRGGNGAVIVELIPEEGTPAGEVGVIDFAYLEASSGESVTDRVSISSPLAPAELEQGAYHFEDASVAKSFVMLNLYVGFEMATQDVGEWDLDGALATLVALCGSVEGWLSENPDEDIEDDLFYLKLFIDNLRANGAGQAGEAGDPWPND